MKEVQEGESTPSPQKATTGSTATVPVQRTQMVLDFGQKLRITCKECGMSYDRSSPEDGRLHAAHHSRMVHGIPWPQKITSLASETDVGPRSLSIKDERKLKSLQGSGSLTGSKRSSSGGSASRSSSSGGSGGAAMGLSLDDNEVAVHLYSSLSSASSNSTALDKKLHEVLSAVDDALGAAPLEASALRGCKLFVAICRGKVVGAVLAGKVKDGAAREVLPRGDNDEGDHGSDADAVFCE
jgi:Arc/MetJ family transcription regulator